MSSDEVVIDVRGLGKDYDIYPNPRARLKQLIVPSLHRLSKRAAGIVGWKFAAPAPRYFDAISALSGVTFNLKKGEALGIVGRNGSGKSTLLQLICNTLSPSSGEVKVSGRVSALLELGSGFNPRYTGRENVFFNGQLLGLSQPEIEARYESIIEFADIGQFVNQPVKTYSSGMVVRLAFAVAIHVDPQILVVDEALSVGDIAFQRKCMAWLQSFQERGGTLLFVSHAPEQVRRLCDRALFLHGGKQVAVGPAKEVCDLYEKHLYGIVGELTELAAPDIPLAEMPAEINGLPRSGAFPECAVQYGDGRAEIILTHISADGVTPKRAFNVGEQINWSFRVCFRRDVAGVAFGLMVKTKEGLNLCSANSRTLEGKHLMFKAGMTVDVVFEIKGHLGAGEYFLNCGVSCEEAGETVFLHRIVDAEIISVSPRDASRSGLVYMEISYSCLPMSP